MESSRLLALPAELRNRIYQFIIDDWKNYERVRDHSWISHTPRLGRIFVNRWAAQTICCVGGIDTWVKYVAPLPAMLWTCRQASKDFRPMLYACSLFEISLHWDGDDEFLAWLDMTGDEGAALIRHIKLSALGRLYVFDFDDPVAVATDEEREHFTGGIRFRGPGYTLMARSSNGVRKMSERVAEAMQHHVREVLGNESHVRLSKTQLRELVLGEEEIAEEIRKKELRESQGASGV